MNSQSYSKSHLKMTKNTHQCIVYFSKLWLLARKFISGRVWKLTDKPLELTLQLQLPDSINRFICQE
jgi:hypothetical protein